MRKPRSPPPVKNNEALARQRMIVYSRRLVIAALVLLVLVGIGDAFYLTWERRSHGHLHAGFATVTMPFAAVLFVVVTWWNWRWILNHPKVPRRGP